MTKRQTPRWGWALTGSGHFLKESLALIRELEHVDLFLSKAGAEVLRMYKQELELPRSVRIYRDTSASSVTVGQFYYGVYHTLIVAPATSNAVAKFVYGISDDFITNVFAQAGKCRVPAIVFACDTAPELETEAPKGMVKVYPRPIDLENRERLGAFRRRDDGRLDRRAPRGDRAATKQSRGMRERILFLTGRLAQSRLEKVLQGMAPTAFDWSILNVGRKGRGADDRAHPHAPAAAPARRRSRGRPGPLPRRPCAPDAGIWRSVRARTRRTEGPARVFRQGRRAARFVAPCAENLRRDRRRFADRASRRFSPAPNSCAPRAPT